VHYIYSKCEDSNPSIAPGGGLACVAYREWQQRVQYRQRPLPAAFTFGVATTQGAMTCRRTSGCFRNRDQRRRQSNLEANGGLKQRARHHRPLTSSGLHDLRQQGHRTFTFGRQFRLFGFDAINQRHDPARCRRGRHASGPAPANTTLGSIGLGYIYVDTSRRWTTTTPDYSGLNFTIGIFDPITALAGGAGAPRARGAGLSRQGRLDDADQQYDQFYGSATFISQKQNFDTARHGVQLQR